MEISRWPTDILRQIFYWLRTKDILKLRGCGSFSFWHRALNEGILRDLSLEQSAQTFHSIQHFGAHLRRLVIHSTQQEGTWSCVSSPVPGLAWVTALPKSLEEIDFKFLDCLSIWLRRISPGELHWSVVANQYGYAPIFLCDHLPNLKQLSLAGSWFYLTVKEETLPYGFVDEFMPYRANRDAKRMKVEWSNPMKALFIKKLPQKLELLEMPLSACLEHFAPHLPPNLVVLRHSRSTLSSLSPQEDNKLPYLKDSLLNSLVDFTWILPSSSFPSLIASFKCLESLELSPVFIASQYYALLPPQLTKLSLNCHSQSVSTSRGYAGLMEPHNPTSSVTNSALDITEEILFDYMDFCHIPRSVKTLELFRCVRPQTASSKSEGFTSNQHLSFLSLLPPELTRLDMLDMMECWNLDTEFSDLKTLSILRSLRLRVHESNASFFSSAPNSHTFVTKSLSWIPVETLQTLELSGDIDSSTFSDLNIPDDLFSTWRCDPSNRITSLKLGGKYSSLSRKHLESSLPPNLTKLELPHASRSVISLPELLRACPSSLLSLTVGSSFSDVFWWDDSEILHNLPPNLTTLVTCLFGSGKLLPEDVLVVSTESLRQLYAKIAVLSRCTPITIPIPDRTYFPISVISIDLPLSTTIDHQIWQLPNLKKAQIAELNWTISTTRPGCHALKTLKIPVPITGKWFLHELFSNLTDLDCQTRDITTTELSNLSTMTKLTTLNFTIGPHGSSLFGMGNPTETSQEELRTTLFCSLPISLTSLQTNERSLGPEFWQKISQLRLTRLNLPNASVEQLQLASLAPHLKEFGAREVVVSDRISIFRNFDRNMEEATEIIFAKALCPSLEKLIKRQIPSATLSCIDWKFSEDITEAEITPLNYVTRERSMPTTEEGLAVAREALALLPRTLKLSKSTLLVPHMGPLLAPTLTRLQIDTPLPLLTHPIEDFLLELPKSLVSLSFALERGSGDLDRLPLPPMLKSLTVLRLRTLTVDAVQKLPPTLTEFLAGGYEAHSEISHFPPSLLHLSLNCVKPVSLLDRLPSSITIFSYLLPNEQVEALDVCRRLESRPFLLFNRYFQNVAAKRNNDTLVNKYIMNLVEKM